MFVRACSRKRRLHSKHCCSTRNRKHLRRWNQQVSLIDRNLGRSFPCVFHFLKFPLLFLFFWTRYEGTPDGVTSRHHSTAMGRTVTVYASMTTEQNRRLTQKETGHQNEVTTSGDLAHVDVELPVEAWPPVRPPCILCTHTRRMRHILGCDRTRDIHRMRRPRRTW